MLDSSLEKKVTINISARGLSDPQVRLIKSINSMISHILTTKDESEFFDGSAETIRMCASLIKQSKFIINKENKSDIPYADQVLEYSIEILQEHINSSNVINYDN